jgi:hypothetical protein
MMALCLVAAFALAGALAASASAQAPTWYECAKAVKVGKTYPTGEYKNSKCTEPLAGGKYLLKEGVGKGKPFKGATKKGTDAVLHIKTWLGDLTVVCKSAKDSGTAALPNVEKEVSISYSSCKALSTKVCTSPGAKKGEIKVTGLRGEFGYVEEAPNPTVVGLRFENEADPGGLMDSFSCEDVEGKVFGQVIGVQSKDINEINKEAETLDEATERYGEHEYEGKKFKPTVNILGWAPELAEIERCSGQECATEYPAHVLKGEFCGEFVEHLLGKECTPPAYLGLDLTTLNKGEALMVKT